MCIKGITKKHNNIYLIDLMGKTKTNFRLVAYFHF